MIAIHMNTIKTEVATKNRKRFERPTRYRRAKSNSPIASIQRVLEDSFGLPEGSVRLVYPGGRKARFDSTVGRLRQRWDVLD